MTHIHAAVLLLIATAANAADRTWLDGKVTAIEKQKNWRPETTAAEKLFGGNQYDQHATVYRIKLADGWIRLADIPQTIFSAAPKPLVAVGDGVRVERPKSDDWSRRVRVVMGAREKRLYFDSSGRTGCK